ncbi:MAG: hypothetical protein ACAI35_10165 [Candidatus Methylacidiphilales bacterium]|nr:hypothetical protein [Candidatus Methylacidiphilales bacterium]
MYKILLSIVAVLAAPLLFSPVASQARDTAATLPPADEWLKKVIAPCFSQDDKVNQAAHKTLEARYISAELRKLLKDDSDEAAKRGEVGRLGFDWVVNGQDIPQQWSVGKPVTKGEVTEVPVHTSVPIDKEHTHYIILKVRPATESGSAAWTIVDARFQDNSTLLGMLKAPYPQ